MIRSLRGRSSPSRGLLIGLAITLAAVVAEAWYVVRQVSRLQTLQTDLADRSRRDSLLLLRIQDDLNSLALAMRDMLDSDGPYPLSAWSAQFERLRLSLDAALRREEELAAASRTPEQRAYLRRSFDQFWDAAGRIFAMAAEGRDEDARAQVRLSLQARQASLSTAVARALVQNNEAEEETARRMQAIYSDVYRQLSWLVAATLGAILITSLYVIRSNRRLFAEVAALSEERRDLAARLIAARESTLGEISRELHDELGQMLTAIGTMLGRAVRQLPVGSPAHADLREVREIAQATLAGVRELSQSLHPSALEQAGLEPTVAWYLSTLRRQTGMVIEYELEGPVRHVEASIAIHVYRVLQESLSNVAKSAGTNTACVRLRFMATVLELEVEDHGKGIGAGPRRGLGLTGMRERAALVGGTVAFETPAEGGTRVRFVVPLPTKPSSGEKPTPQEKRVARAG